MCSWCPNKYTRLTHWPTFSEVQLKRFMFHHKLVNHALRHELINESFASTLDVTECD